MTVLDDLAASCHPDDDAHPRYRGVRVAGRAAALEVTVLAGLFGACVLVDTASAAVRRLLKGARS